MDPQAIPGQTRKVGTLSVGGRPRPLWVAPTSRGGFCYMLERVGGGCLRNEAFELPTIAVTGSQRMLRGGPFELTLLGGTVHSDRVQRLTVEYRDGHREDVPFVYVSAPIDAGFFSYDVPAGRRERPSAPVAVAGWDADDKLVHREPVRFGPMPLPFPARAEPQTLPAQPPKPPAAPFQRASAKGVSVVAGRNGIAVFDATGLREDIASMLEARRVGLGCFKLRGDGSDARSLLVSGKFSRRVGLELSGLGTPFDGCEIQGSYGHAWPDRLGSHSAVELPFTIAGRRYFDDRAAARDLALFVRSRKVQQIRKEPGEKFAAALKANYGDAIVRLSSRDAQPPPATIGYWVRDGQASFVRLSPTGRRFLVDTQAGRIVHENVKPLALVF